MSLPSVQDLQERLTHALQRHGVPGAVVGVDVAGERRVAAAGLSSVRTGASVTPATLFQVGSITKVYTATAVLRLVDEGRLRLDDCLAGHLPELTLADADAAQRITVAHLLTHAAGLEGDHFAGPRGAEPVREYVEDLRDWPLLHEPGALSSYCNVGWVLLGRVVERVTGMRFHEALRSLVLAPAGLGDTLEDPEQLLLRPVAVGHVFGPDGPAVTPAWRLDPGAAPAGTTLCASIDDLLDFALLHLRDGRAPDGGEVLHAATAQAMRAPHLRRHGVTAPAWAGYGWGVYDWGGTRVVAHDGATAGHVSSLVVVPEHDAVFAVLANGANGMPMHAELTGTLVRETLGIQRPGLPAPSGTPVDPAPYVGRYRRAGVETVVRPEGDRLLAEISFTLVRGAPPLELTVELRPAGDRFLHGPIPPLGEGPVDFLLQDGQARWMFSLGRAQRRVA